MLNLNFPNGTFDQENTFLITYTKISKLRGNRTIQIKAYLFFDDTENRIYALSCGDCVKAKYTESDRNELQRLNNQETLQHGDSVTIQGELYKIHVNGQFSDCAYFLKSN